MPIITDTPLPEDPFSFPAVDSAPLPPTSPPASQEIPAFVGINAEGTMFVNGKTFDVNDAQSALDSEAELNKPIQPLPAGFTPLRPDEYKAYLNGIDNPSFGTLLSKNFGIGVDVVQQNAARQLQFVGLEKLGAGIAATQAEDLRRNQPFQRAATDVSSVGKAAEFVAANLVQQIPIMAEIMAQALIGSGVGLGLKALKVGGLAVKAGRVANTLAGRKALAGKIVAAAKKQTAGKALLAEETALLRKAAKVGGAAVGAIGGQYAFGVGDIFGEQIDSGTPNRLTTAGLAVLYAAADVIPEAIGIRKFFSGVGGGITKRVSKGVGAGFIVEGVPEVAQEGILLSQNKQVDANSPEGINRLINALITGGVIGGAIGGAGGVFSASPAVQAQPGATPPRVDTNADKVDVLRQGPTTQDVVSSANTQIAAGAIITALSEVRAARKGIAGKLDEMATGATEFNQDIVDTMISDALILDKMAAELETRIQTNPDPEFEAVRQRLSGLKQGLNLADSVPAVRGGLDTTAPISLLAPQEPLGGNFFPGDIPVANLNAAFAGRNLQQTPAAPEAAAALLDRAVLSRNESLPVTGTPAIPAPRVSFPDAGLPPALAQALAALSPSGSSPLGAQMVVPSLPVAPEGAAAAINALNPNRQATPTAAPVTPVPGQADLFTTRDQPVVFTPQQEAAPALTPLAATQIDLPLTGGAIQGDLFGTVQQSVVDTPLPAPIQGTLLTQAGKPRKRFSLGGKKDADKKSGAARLSKKKQAGGTGAAGGRDKSVAANPLTKKGKAETKAAAQAAVDKPTGQKKPKAPVRKRKQPADVGKMSLVDSVAEIKTTSDLTRQRLLSMNVFREALFTPTDKESKEAATQIVYGLGEEGGVFWEVGGEGYRLGHLGREAFFATVKEMNSPSYTDSKGNLKDFARFGLAQGIIPETDQRAKVKPTGASPAISPLVKDLPANAEVRDIIDTVLDEAAQDVADIVALMEGTPGTGGNTFRTGGTKITAPLSHGTVKAFVSKAMGRFVAGKRPIAMTFRSVADLKKRNPKLYTEAVASRTDRKAIPEDAAGYAFGKTVLIFSGNIATKQQLAFVLAHEVLGHIGMSAILPKNKYNALLTGIYNDDYTIRAEADRRVDLHGLDQLEATEEALADYAAEVDSSIILRVRDAIKNFLNKLGFAFTDDMARYLVFQSRRYIIDGTQGDVSPSAVLATAQRIEARYLEGRASVGTNLFDMSTLARGTWTSPGVEMNVARIESVLKRSKSIKGLKRNITGAKRLIGKSLEAFQTLGNMALRSPGLTELVTVFKEHTEDVREAQTALEGMAEFSFRANLLNRSTPGGTGAVGEPGPTRQETLDASQLLTAAARYKSAQATEVAILKGKTLISIDKAGVVSRNEAGVTAAKESGAITRTQFASGKTVRFQKIDNIKGGMAVDTAGKPVFEAYKPDFEITDRVWKIYVEQRSVVDESALLVLLATQEGAVAQKEAALRAIQKANPAYTDADVAVLRDIAEAYNEMISKGSSDEGLSKTNKDTSIDTAESFMREIQRALWSKEKLADWKGKGKPRTDGKVEPTEVFRKDPRLKSIVNGLDELNAHTGSKTDAGAKVDAASIVAALKNFSLLDTSVINADLYAKRTIMGAYSKFDREGRLQVTLKVRDASTKEPVALHPTLKGLLPNFRTDSDTQADAIIKELLSVYKEGDTPLKLLNSANELVEVEFFADKSEAAKTSPMSETTNFDEFTRTLMRFNIDLTPQKRDRLVKVMTAQHSAARANLMRNAVPGESPDMVRSNAAHVQTQTHLIGSKRHGHRVNDLFMQDDLWFGDPAVEKVLAEKLRVATEGGNDAAIQIARRKLTEYQHQLLHSRGEVTVRQPDGTLKVIKGEGKGRRYKDVAASLVAFYHENTDIIDTVDKRLDVISGALMEGSAFIQLGGSVSVALINTIALASHAIPYLATHNKVTGYGGGHGLGAATRAIAKAAKDMRLFSVVFKSVGGINGVIVDMKKDPEATFKKYGIPMDELIFLRDETAKGVLTPNLTNMLRGTAQAGRHSNNRTKILGTWMSMFSATEQFNRRTVGTASYRLEKARMLRSGMKESDLAPGTDGFKELINRSTIAINMSQGEYSMYNRPAWARSGLGRLLYTYKQFVVISIELMKNLGPAERNAFLLALFFLSGVKGLPFAENMFDLIDTLAQKFGIPFEGTEVGLAKFFDAVVPGLTPIMMSGLVNYYAGVSASTRLGQGKPLPGTGIFKAGADTGRELINMFGPVASAVNGVVATAALGTKFLAGKAGLRPDTTSAASVARSGFGVAAVRGITEGLIYMSDGAITNDRGQLISKDVGVLDVVTRMMGFYPGVAAAQGEVVRMTRGASMYAQEIRTTFKNDRLVAEASRDRAKINQIKQEVRDWNNRVGRKSIFFIRDFEGSIRKALREANRTTPARFLRSAPTGSKPLVKRMISIYGLTN